MHLRCENWSRARSSHGAMRTAVGINWTPSCGLAFAQSSRCPKPDSVDSNRCVRSGFNDLKTADTFNHSRLILSLASSRTVSSGQRGRLAARYDATVAVFHVPAVPTSQWSRRRVPWKAAAVGSCTSPCTGTREASRRLCLCASCPYDVRPLGQVSRGPAAHNTLLTSSRSWFGVAWFEHARLQCNWQE